MATNKDKVVKRNDGVNGIYSKETLDNGSTIELLSRRNPNESVTYTERFITPQQDTSYYIYNNTTPYIDRHVIGGKYVTPTKYNKMGWLGKRIIAGVRPDSWDAKFDSYQEPVDVLQEGGEVPSNDQQQLFIAIITDMAKTLGVEPSQEFAEAVITAFENQDDSQGLLTLFTKTKDKFMNETGLFREGGKMIAFIEKFKCGGKSPKKTSKKQDGGEVELSRRGARDLSKITKGYSNENFRTAYRNAKSAIADNTNLRGREKRMAARRMVSGITDLLNPAQPIAPSAPALAVETPTLNAPTAISAPATPVSATPRWTPTNASINKGDETYTVQAGNTIGQIVAEYNRQNGTNLKWQDVMKWNNISDPKRMQIGHTIRFSDPAAQATPATPAAAPSSQQTAPARPTAPADSTVRPTVPADSTARPQVDSTMRPGAPADSTMRPPVDSTMVAPVDSTARPQVDSTMVAPADSTGAVTPQVPVQNNAYYEWLRRQVGMSGVWPNGQVPTLNVPTITMPSFDYSNLPE